MEDRRLRRRAAWLPPGVAGRFDEIEQSARAAINPLTDDGGVRYAMFWDWLGAHLPGGPCWFLDLVAVAPAAQGRGRGRRLVMHGLDLARADGCPAFLETSTPRNVPFYQSLGFQIVDEQRAPDGGPMIWFMQTPRLPGQVPQRLMQDHPVYISRPSATPSRSRARRLSGGAISLIWGREVGVPVHELPVPGH